MNEQVNNHDIVNAGNNLADILTLINDNLCRLANKVNDMELDGSAFTDSVVAVIDSYDMEPKVTEELRHSDYLTSDDLDDELVNHRVAYKDDLDDIDVDVDGAVSGALHDLLTRAAKEADPHLTEIRERNIGERAVAEYKKAQAKVVEDKAKELDKSLAEKAGFSLPPLPPLPKVN
tara:strand:- start:9565 stop:10092 length:528 start_codon:yes stop_codon:yes gene_type:complete